MSDLEIKKVTGGASGALLKGCSFRPLGGTPPVFDFYDSSPAPGILVNSVKKDVPFRLAFAGFNWEIKVTSVSGSLVSGTWKNRNSLGNGEEEGTFQAQAGGHTRPDPGEEEEARSSATAFA